MDGGLRPTNEQDRLIAAALKDRVTLAFEGRRYGFISADEIGPTFEENLGAALALINCAGFDAPADVVKIEWTPGVTVAQVVRNGWKVFEGFGP